MLWAGRDYERSGEYYQHAIELARINGDRSTLAHSLNRLGNWLLNVERPLEALAHHQEALNIFQGLADQSGIAETLDLLGMTSYLSGDLLGGTAYYVQAVALFRELDDRQGLTSSLATLTMRSITYQTDTMIPAVAHVSEVTADGELALNVARETEQRAAEAYALIFLAFCLGPQGDYARALECAGQGLRIAEEIDHRQWMTAAHCALGALYRDLLALPQAQHHLEQALQLANEISSYHWIRTATGHLASTYVLAHELLQAETILNGAFDATAPAQTLGQRLVWCARAELALAQNDASQALQIVEQLITSAAPIDDNRAILRLAMLHAEALTALNQASEAEVILQRAGRQAQQQGTSPLLWRIHLALARCLQAQRRYEALLSRSGLAPDATIVFYGYGPSLGFWLMKAYGHERALVMNGTREGWRDAGRPWMTDHPEPVVSTYPLPEAEVTQLMSLDVLQGTLGSGDPIILDVRSDAEFAGERFWPSGATAGAGRPGHIPGAVHLHADLLRTADGAFKNAAEVRQLLQDRGVVPERGVVTYCTIGIRASEAALVLRYLLGYPDVRVYYGSWAEWGTRVETPIGA